MSHSNGEEEKSTGDKLKHPFHELKEKLEGTHLHNFKVGLIHQKYVPLNRKPFGDERILT